MRSRTSTLRRCLSLASLVSLALVAGCGATASTDSEPDAGPGDPAGADAAAGDPDAPAGQPDAAAPTADAAGCTVPTDCPSELCEAGVCVVDQLVPCADVAPADATAIVVDVPITYVDGAGWTEPAACEWTCTIGHCRVGAGCATDAPDPGHDPDGAGSRWFGGDDRDLDGDGVMDIRSVGAGESFTVGDPIAVTAVALGFSSGFYSAATGVAHGAHVIVALRAADGTLIADDSRAVAATFTGGWLTWNLNATLPAGDYVLTAYVPGVFAGQNYTAAIETDYDAGFAGGDAYVKEIHEPGGMASWTGWAADPNADHAFAIAAACPM